MGGALRVVGLRLPGGYVVYVCPCGYTHGTLTAHSCDTEGTFQARKKIVSLTLYFTCCGLFMLKQREDYWTSLDCGRLAAV
jgi:hypothetical protein